MIIGGLIFSALVLSWS